jgi:hypothetical protein
MGPRIAPDAKPYTFRYASPEKEFSLELKFRRTNVSAAEVADALRKAAHSLGKDQENSQTTSAD